MLLDQTRTLRQIYCLSFCLLPCIQKHACISFAESSGRKLTLMCPAFPWMLKTIPNFLWKLIPRSDINLHIKPHCQSFDAPLTHLGAHAPGWIVSMIFIRPCTQMDYYARTA